MATEGKRETAMGEEWEAVVRAAAVAPPAALAAMVVMVEMGVR